MEWYRNYNNVVNFYEENKRWPENISGDEYELKLYKWCNQQRIRNKNCEDYPTEYVYLLNSIKFDWRISNPMEDKIWMDNYNAIISYIIDNNRMPGYKDKNNRGLYTWYRYNLQMMDYWAPCDWRIPYMQKIVDAVTGLKLHKK